MLLHIVKNDELLGALFVGEGLYRSDFEPQWMEKFMMNVLLTLVASKFGNSKKNADHRTNCREKLSTRPLSYIIFVIVIHFPMLSILIRGYFFFLLFPLI
jgi:hypothetical protein